MTSADASQSQRAAISSLLRQALPASAVRHEAQDLRQFKIADRLPEAVVLPETADNVAGVLRMAHGEGWGVVPWGAGRDMGMGRAPTRYQVALSLSRMNKVLEHDAENLTLTAQAGLPLAAANSALRPAHQFSALGQEGDSRTLGGLVAMNTPVPRRLVYGDIRDQLLSVAVAMPDGRLVRFGRKVIKNVAGYDMNKLFTGSAGTLGVIVEVTLKLSALPDEAAVAAARFDSAENAAAAASELYRSRLAPAQIVLMDGRGATACLGAATAGDPGLRWVCVGFEGRKVGVRRQIHDALAILTRHGGMQADVFSPWSAAALAWLERPAPPAPTMVVIRLGAEPTRLGAWADALGKLGGKTGTSVLCDYGGGWLRCAFDNIQPGESATFATGLERLRKSVESERGYLAIERAPAPIMEQVGPWGTLGGEAALMQILRHEMDPKEILSPGRFK